jgi:RHS repeat-associated protein
MREGLVAERFNVTSTPTSVTTRYFHLDSLGSVAVLTDENGVVPADGRQSYDAWGKRRFPNGTDDTTGSITSESSRGFTGHEELDDVGLVHMNGRVYDPFLGRFTSADPTVQQPFNSQGWNRYAYVGNNPLAFTDPNGYGWLSFLSHIFNPVQILQDHVSILRAAYHVPVLGTVLNVAITGVVTYYTGGCVACGTAVASALQTGVTSGKLGLALEAGAIAAVEAEAAQFGPEVSGAVTGALTSAQGGSFRRGFEVGAFAGFAAGIPDAGPVGNILVNATVSGTASVIGGGKFESGAINGAAGAFANGALTVAFAYAASSAPGDQAAGGGMGIDPAAQTLNPPPPIPGQEIYGPFGPPDHMANLGCANGGSAIFCTYQLQDKFNEPLVGARYEVAEIMTGAPTANANNVFYHVDNQGHWVDQLGWGYGLSPLPAPGTRILPVISFQTFTARVDATTVYPLTTVFEHIDAFNNGVYDNRLVVLHR